MLLILLQEKAACVQHEQLRTQASWEGEKSWVQSYNTDSRVVCYTKPKNKNMGGLGMRLSSAHMHVHQKYEHKKYLTKYIFTWALFSGPPSLLSLKVIHSFDSAESLGARLSLLSAIHWASRAC